MIKIINIFYLEDVIFGRITNFAKYNIFEIENVIFGRITNFAANFKI